VNDGDLLATLMSPYISLRSFWLFLRNGLRRRGYGRTSCRSWRIQYPRRYGAHRNTCRTQPK